MSKSSKIIQIKPIKQEVIKNEPMDSVEDQEQKTKERLNQLHLEIEEALKKKEQVLKDIETEVENARNELEKERQVVLKQTEEQGFQEGYKQGLEEGQQQYAEKLDQVNTIVKTAQEEHQQIIDHSQQDIVHLAMKVAEKILTKKLEEEPKAFMPILSEAINDLKEKSVITIYLNPVNYEYVVKQKDELTQIIGEKTDLSIYVSDVAEVGSCIIEHPYGKIDASIDTQLQEIRQVLDDIVMENKQ